MPRKFTSVVSLGHKARAVKRFPKARCMQSTVLDLEVVQNAAAFFPAGKGHQCGQLAKPSDSVIGQVLSSSPGCSQNSCAQVIISLQPPE